MRQKVLTIASEVQPGSVAALRFCIKALRDDVQQAAGGHHAEGYDVFGGAIPGLHFAAVMIFEDERYDPLLTVELNFDGDAGPFLPRLETPILQGALRDMVRCCKPPRGAGAALYAAVTEPNSRLPLAPYLESCIVRPAAFHQGNRGLDLERILREAALFREAQEALAGSAFAAPNSPVTVHADLRRVLRRKYPWLDEPEPLRWTIAELSGDLARLVGFVVLMLFCLSVPGMVLNLLLPWQAVLVIDVVRTLGFAGLIRRISPAQAAEVSPSASPALPSAPSTPPAQVALLWVGVVAVLVAALVVFVLVTAGTLTLPLLPFHHTPAGSVLKAAIAVVTVGLVSAVPVVASLAYWLRRLEISDDAQEIPNDDPERLRAIAALEDQVAQNHMGSVVLVKPGLLRAALLRAGLAGLGLAARLLTTNGYLGTMRTIHFAHWAVLSNGGRLAFFSNFDGSWESYLDDFIDKARPGVNLAWTNGVGFPPTRFLVGRGSALGRQFKTWARHSMAESLFWYSAYKDLSVNQIERQARVASGLRRSTLTPEEADVWARDL